MGKIKYVIATVLALAAAVGIIIWSSVCLPAVPARPEGMQHEFAEETTPESTPEPLNEQETLTGETITEGLQDMGKLVTAEYFFTEVVEYSSMKNLWIASALTKSDFLISYDGTISAGVNLEEAVVQKDDESKTVIVSLPNAEVLSFNVDHDSFRKYHEREGIGNPITVDNYNEALQSVQNTMEEKAIQKGLIKIADKNAETIVRQFVESLVNPQEYQIKIVRC